MKTFWFIVALLVVAGAALLIVGKPQERVSSGQTASPSARCATESYQG
jgi:hypothetical protein